MALDEHINPIEGHYFCAAGQEKSYGFSYIDLNPFAFSGGPGKLYRRAPLILLMRPFAIPFLLRYYRYRYRFIDDHTEGGNGIRGIMMRVGVKVGASWEVLARVI